MPAGGIILEVLGFSRAMLRRRYYHCLPLCRPMIQQAYRISAWHPDWRLEYECPPSLDIHPVFFHPAHLRIYEPVMLERVDDQGDCIYITAG